ncbi:MAG: MoaD/ThiS family protein [Acidimicrobiales bacterium]
MSVTVRVPTQLRSLTDESKEVSAPAGALREVIDSLESVHPGIKARILDDDNRLRRFVTLFVDDEDVRLLGGLETVVNDDQTLSIVPSVAGG